MTNRNKLFCLILFTAIAGIINGCDAGSETVLNQTTIDNEDKHIAWCIEHSDAWGCPGLPCLDNECVAGTCQDSSQDDAGICCLDSECLAL